MLAVRRTPSKTPRPQIGNISQKESRSEPDITSAVNVSEYVNSTIRHKRLRKDDSMQGGSSEITLLDIQDTLANWKKEQDSIIAKLLADQTTVISKLSSDIGDIKIQNSQIQISNTEICKVNAGIVESIAFMNKRFEEVRAEVETLRRERREQQKYIEHLEQKIQDIHHKSRSSGIELRNIPQENTETTSNLIKTVRNIGELVGVQISETELRDIYRLPRKSTLSAVPSPIIAEFSTVQTKHSLLSAVRTYNKGKGIENKLNTAVVGIPGERKPVYISEHLPSHTKKLFFLAREFANKNAYKFCWISNGNIFLRKIEGDKQILISSEKCLNLTDINSRNM